LNQVKKLAGQTMIYGLGSILPKVLNYLILTVFYTHLFQTGEYGIVSELYAYLVILLVVIEWGMESGFFRYAASEGDYKKVFSHSLGFVAALSLIWMLVVYLFTDGIAGLIRYGSNPEYIIWFAWIIALDSIASIPFAKMRQENRALRFAILKILNVVINVALVFTFYLVFPALVKKGINLPSWLYDPDIGVGYVFIANLITSSIMMLLLIPEFRHIRMGFDRRLMKKLLVYATPLMLVGVAGAINDAGDKIILKFLLPDQETALSGVGEYSANNRIAVIMMLFIQMFRYAFEPFLFSVSGEKNAEKTYAQVMKYFVLFGLLIFLGTTLYIDIVQRVLIDERYWGGLPIVPYILMGYLFLGIYYNLSVWYKIKDHTLYATIMAGTGTVVTLALNWLLIPAVGYMGSAWAKLACYLVMMLLSFFWGRKFYRVPYEAGRLALWTATAVGIYVFSVLLRPDNLWIRLLFNTVLMTAFLVVVAWREKAMVRSVVSGIRSRFHK